MSCNESDIDFLSDEINEVYYRFVKIQVFMGGLILISTFTNMSILCSIKSKILELKNDVKNNIFPPLYKVSS